MALLRSRISDCEQRERKLLERAAAHDLESGGPLGESEFLAIVRRSQHQLAAHYEEKIAFMQAEMDRFYAHATDCIQEKDSITDALKRHTL